MRFSLFFMSVKTDAGIVLKKKKKRKKYLEFSLNLQQLQRNDQDGSSTYAYVYLLIVSTEVIKLENLIKIFTVSILSLCLPYVLFHSRRFSLIRALLFTGFILFHSLSFSLPCTHFHSATFVCCPHGH